MFFTTTSDRMACIIQARSELTQMEVFIQGKSQQAAFEFRDALDHIANMISAMGNESEFIKHSKELETHLSRVRMESGEQRAEHAVLRLKKRLALGTWWWRIFFIDPKIEPRALKATVVAAKEEIAEGRMHKGIRGEHFQKFVSARIRCENATNEIDLAGYQVRMGQLVGAFFVGSLLLLAGYLLGIMKPQTQALSAPAVVQSQEQKAAPSTP